MITELVEPNGLAFSPDEKKLCVIEWKGTPNHSIWSYGIGGITLSNRTQFFDASDLRNACRSSRHRLTLELIDLPLTTADYHSISPIATFAPISYHVPWHDGFRLQLHQFIQRLQPIALSLGSLRIGHPHVKIFIEQDTASDCLQ